MPSHNEGVPKALLEALAAGCLCYVNHGIQAPKELRKFVKEVDCSKRFSFDVFHSECIKFRYKQQYLAVKHYLQESENQLDIIYKEFI